MNDFMKNLAIGILSAVISGQVLAYCFGIGAPNSPTETVCVITAENIVINNFGTLIVNED